MAEEVENNELMGDQVTERALECVAVFNEDMKTLACHSFKLDELLENLLQEHDELNRWFTELESMTLKTEEVMVQQYKQVTAVYKSLK